MKKQMKADVQYLAQQGPEQMRMILSGMAAAMQNIDGKANAMQSQNWFQRMIMTVTGKNKLTLEEIQRNRDKLNSYMADAIAELYRLGQVDHRIIMSLGTQIDEIYMEHTQMKKMLGAFAAKLNEKIESVDNFHMLYEEINQGVYSTGVPISNIIKVLSQFDRRILESPRKLNLIRLALEQQNIISDNLMALSDYFTDVLRIPMAEAGQVYMELGAMRGGYLVPPTMKLMESYHFLPDADRRLKNPAGLADKFIHDEFLPENAALSTAEIYDTFVKRKVDIQNGLSLPASRDRR